MLARSLVGDGPVIWLRHHTKQVELRWVKRSIRFARKRHPCAMREAEAGAFLAVVQNAMRVDAGPAARGVTLAGEGCARMARRWRDMGEEAPRIVRRAHAGTECVPCSINSWLTLPYGLRYGAGLRVMTCLRLNIKTSSSGYARVAVRDEQEQRDQDPRTFQRRAHAEILMDRRSGGADSDPSRLDHVAFSCPVLCP